MNEYRYYTPEDDKRTIAFYIIMGGIITSVVLWHWFFMIFSIAATYLVLRCIKNVDEGKPVYMPGKHSRHIQDSLYRLTNNEYGGGYFSRTDKDRHY